MIATKVCIIHENQGYLIKQSSQYELRKNVLHMNVDLDVNKFREKWKAQLLMRNHLIK